MKILRTLKQLILQTDFFYSTQMLRYNSELQYKTLTGGIISLGIIVTILVGFASMILSTLDLSTISTSTQIIKNKDPPSSVIDVTPDSPFRFAVEIWHLNLSDTRRYFDVIFQHWYWENGVLINSTTVPMETCNRDYFAQYPEITDKFDHLNASFWLCPSLNLSMDIYGKYASLKYSEFVTVVQACNNDTNPSQPCHSPEEIQAFMDASQYVYFTVYFTNTQINSDHKVYKQYYIEDKSYSIFGGNIGTESYLYFTDYTVSTDYSIWPFTNQIDDKGVLVQNLAVNHPFPSNINSSTNVFIYFAFCKGANSIVYSRQVQKLSAVFSFMGGMIGAVSAVLFFVKVYTSLSYQFSIALELFKPQKKVDEDDQPKQLFSFNFFNFLRYYIYELIKKMGVSMEWPVAIKYAKVCRSQILKQLDVKALLKRIIFIEHCLNYLIEDYQLDALQIKKPTKPEEIRQIRQKFQSVLEADVEYSEYEAASSYQAELRVEVLEPAEEYSGNTPSGIIAMQGDSLSKKIVSFKFDNISNANESSHRNDEKCSQFPEDIVVIDMENMKELSAKSHENETNGPRRREMKVKRRSKVHNQWEKRTTFLSKLKQNAEQGNEISSKIWKDLNQKYKDDLENAKS